MRLALAFSIAASVAASTFVVASPAEAREAVSFREDFAPGTVVIKHSQRRLYYVVGGGKAIAYTVGVGRAGKSWFGTRYIDGKRIRPAWSPPREVKRDNPRLPNVIPGGVPTNPMGAAALTLSRRRIRHPRHQRAGLDRRLRVVWLHPHAQFRHPRSVRSRRLRHARGRDAVTTSRDDRKRPEAAILLSATQGTSRRPPAGVAPAHSAQAAPLETSVRSARRSRRRQGRVRQTRRAHRARSHIALSAWRQRVARGLACAIPARSARHLRRVDARSRRGLMSMPGHVHPRLEGVAVDHAHTSAGWPRHVDIRAPPLDAGADAARAAVGSRSPARSPRRPQARSQTAPAPAERRARPRPADKSPARRTRNPARKASRRRRSRSIGRET